MGFSTTAVTHLLHRDDSRFTGLLHIPAFVRTVFDQKRIWAPEPERGTPVLTGKEQRRKVRHRAAVNPQYQQIRREERQHDNQEPSFQCSPDNSGGSLRCASLRCGHGVGTVVSQFARAMLITCAVTCPIAAIIRCGRTVPIIRDSLMAAGEPRCRPVRCLTGRTILPEIMSPAFNAIIGPRVSRTGHASCACSKRHAPDPCGSRFHVSGRYAGRWLEDVR